MTDWVLELERVDKLQEHIEDDPDEIATVGADLVSLTCTDAWIVRRYAANALADVAQTHPESVIDLLDDLVEVVLDPAVSTPPICEARCGQWRLPRRLRVETSLPSIWRPRFRKTGLTARQGFSVGDY